MCNHASLLRVLGVFVVLTMGVHAEEREGERLEGGRGPGAAWNRFWGSTVRGGESVARGVSDSLLGLLGKGRNKDKAGQEAPRDLKIESSVELENPVISLTKERQLRGILRLVNRGGRTQALQFPTSQRVEAVLRNAQGKIVARAFEDRQWLEEEGILTINPKERVEFELSLPTRDLGVGEGYILEVAVVNHGGLRVQVPLRVEP